MLTNKMGTKQEDKILWNEGIMVGFHDFLAPLSESQYQALLKRVKMDVLASLFSVSCGVTSNSPQSYRGLGSKLYSYEDLNPNPRAFVHQSENPSVT